MRLRFMYFSLFPVSRTIPRWFWTADGLKNHIQRRHFLCWFCHRHKCV